MVKNLETIFTWSNTAQNLKVVKGNHKLISAYKNKGLETVQGQASVPFLHFVSEAGKEGTKEKW